jgi:6-pyruvoyltetrahydropterin/6-carboxytetrahydropterin synthase
MDLGKLERLLREILAELDHAVLNDVPGLEKPTFENILLWIESKMKAAGVAPSRLEIERPTLRQRAVYTPA